MNELGKTFKAQYLTIAAAVCVTLLAGAAEHLLRAEKYEVSLLAECRLSTMGSYSTNLPWTVKAAVDSGLLTAETAKKAGLPESALPRFGATVCYPSQMVKIYALVPLDGADAAKATLLALFQVLAEKFPMDNRQYFTRLARLSEQVAELDGGLQKISSGPGTAGTASEATDLKAAAERLRKDGALLQDEGASLHIFGLRLIAPPSTAASPSTPTLFQTLTGFGLLGLFTGLSAALWRERNREGV